jgi:hypothetical protein
MVTACHPVSAGSGHPGSLPAATRRRLDQKQAMTGGTALALIAWIFDPCWQARCVNKVLVLPLETKKAGRGSGLLRNCLIPWKETGAGEAIRTLDPNLGKRKITRLSSSVRYLAEHSSPRECAFLQAPS